jgi:polyisoprenoid-binding protein YceI
MPDRFLIDLLGTALPLVCGGFLAGMFTYFFERRRIRLERKERREVLLESLRRELRFVPDRLPTYSADTVHLLPPIRTIVGAQLLDGEVLDWRSDAELVQPLLEFLSVAAIYNDLVGAVNAAQASQAWADDVRRHWHVQLVSAHASLLNTERALQAQLSPLRAQAKPKPERVTQFGPLPSPTDPWRVDPTHTRIGFSARHMGIVTVNGQFERAEIQLDYRPGGETDATVEVRIDASSVNTRDERRDADLRSEHFLNSEVYPWLIFTSTAVESVAPDTFRLVGDLTMRDVTRPVSLEVRASKPQSDGHGGEHRGFSMRGRINRTDWGLTWNVALEAGGLLVSEEIELLIDIAAFGPTAATTIAATQAVTA